ncbi:Radical SAM domain protein [Chthoniobacter flavus Ellin428]|uniref:7-carboxy-7-deazaguanine synthase n=1 Tax=Chthoniobacter flavus Ellin428 TaxID=497964 RepID=B4D1V4_9BACT|nr:7-carboxy-7-deazaguanine synthase QueE [Chthoniobacter flavus]EDY19716.1 Radical SAM domain protein [Chthoniobacter flavus Ellin428]TCO92947.1 7-carboxy-7-deazaguanine synthase [Chthoniobacter flavus]
MLISEIFYSIQGEGELTGVPSVFVRTSGCNLRCRWCDTKYASWNPQGDEMSIAEIFARVDAFPATHVVLTGGEPMVAKGIHELAQRFREAGKHITIETAGTIAPEGIACDLASLSPKLGNSTPLEGEIAEGWRERHEKARLQPEVLRAWIERHPFQLKFVVEQSSDVEEIEALLDRIGAPIPPHKVQLMPQGTDLQTIHGREESLIDLCKRRGYRYCHRLHIALFGNTRGT